MKEARLVVRLTGTEKTAINQLAALERLPASTLARRILLREAERRGLLPKADTEGTLSRESDPGVTPIVDAEQRSRHDG